MSFYKNRQKTFLPLNVGGSLHKYKQKEHLSGFTIIELIVVIAIIVILSAIVIVNVTQYIEKSKITATKAEISQIAKAMELYRAKYGCLPPADTDGDGVKCTSNDDWHTQWTGDMQADWDTVANELASEKLIGDGSLLHDDAWGVPYEYDKNDGACCGLCSNLYSYGPNGENDGSDWGWTCDQSAFVGDDIGINLPHGCGTDGNNCSQ